MNIINTLATKMNNVSMKWKLLTSYAFIVFVPVLMVGLILTNGMRDMAFKQAVNQANTNVDMIQQRLAEAVNLATDISDKIYTDRALTDILEKKYSTTLELYNDYSVYKDFNDYVSIYPDKISNIRLYTFNPSMLSNGNFIKPSQETTDLIWYKNAIKNNGRISCSYIFNEQKNNYNLSLIRLVKNVAGNSLGILVIDINNKYFRSFLENNQFETIVLDNENNIIQAKDTDLIGKKYENLNLKEYNVSDNAMLPVEYNKNKSISIIRNFTPVSSDSKLKIISIFATSVIMSEPDRISILGFSIIGASILLSLILIYLFSNALSSRTKRLCDSLDDVTLGIFDVSITVDGRDEIGQLSKSIRFMLERIKELVSEVYEINMQKQQLIINQKEIKLSILANQINPHFLFNVLETVRSKAQRAGENDITEIVKLLGKILRKNLETDNEPIPLSTDIDLVKSYLKIQKYRYGQKLDYCINLNSDINNYKILPLIIQPVVENSIIHGLEGKVGNGKVVIDITTAGGFLNITVSDDGLGIDEDNLNGILQSLNEQPLEKSRRIGLRNVHQRIKLHYGEMYGLKIYSKQNEGTRVEILLPEEGDCCAEFADN